MTIQFDSRLFALVSMIFAHLFQGALIIIITFIYTAQIQLYSFQMRLTIKDLKIYLTIKDPKIYHKKKKVIIF